MSALDVAPQEERSPFPVLALFLVVLGVWMRTWNIESCEFKLDEVSAMDLGHQLLKDRPWATDAHWPTAGMRSSQAIKNPPLFNYVMALLVAIGRTPKGATALVALINGLSLWPFFQWARAEFGSKRGLTILGVVACSPLFVLYSRKVWAQDLLFPGIVMLLVAWRWTRTGRGWQGVALGLAAWTLITQLHASGPFLLVTLTLVVLVHWRLHPETLPWRSWNMVTFPQLVWIAVGGGSFLLFWGLFANYLLHGGFAELGSHRQETYAPWLLWRFVKQVAPWDLFWFLCDKDYSSYWKDWSYQPLGYVFRTGGMLVACASGAVLGLLGLWRAFGNPWRLAAFFPAWILMFGVFTAVRAVDYPHYLLIVQPLVALLIANAFTREDEKFARAWDRLRWVHVAACACAWMGTSSWLVARGGGEWPYGTSLGMRQLQAKAVFDDVKGNPIDVTEPTWETDEQVARTFPCSPPPNEVEWILRHEFDPNWRTPPGTILCEGWRDLDGARRIRWRIVHNR